MDLSYCKKIYDFVNFVIAIQAINWPTAQKMEDGLVVGCSLEDCRKQTTIWQLLHFKAYQSFGLVELKFELPTPI